MVQSICYYNTDIRTQSISQWISNVISDRSSIYSSHNCAYESTVFIPHLESYSGTNLCT
jgi:hypothetical protein